MLDKAYAVIMAGGKGERFWPLSTSKHPKQVLSLVGDKPMLAMAVDYLQGLIPNTRILVITSADLVAVTRKAVPKLPAENIIGEPFGRDTAAVCALASALVKARDPKATFCVLTADHVIKDTDLFRNTLSEAFDLARQGKQLVTIGMKPTFPNTGFGYIEVAQPVLHGKTIRFFKARRFVEKPNLATAKRYLRSGRYFWNAGMFIWSVPALQTAMETFCPYLKKMADRLEKVAWTPLFKSALRKEYSHLEKISVDYALMEKAPNICMAVGEFPWDDVGSWPALENQFGQDENGNTLIGDCAQLESSGNVVVSQGRLTALIGVNDLVVVQAGKVTLICPKNRAQEVKKMVHHLAAKGSRYKGLL